MKKAKNSHWVDFLAKTTPHNIWTAKKFVAPRKTPRFPDLLGANSPVEINEALLAHLFPPKPELPPRGASIATPRPSHSLRKRSLARWPNPLPRPREAPMGSRTQFGKG